MHNFDKLQWKGPDAPGVGWEATPPASLVDECCSVWPSLSALVDAHCDTWLAFPLEPLRIKVTIEERSSVGELTGEHSACRSTLT